VETGWPSPPWWRSRSLRAATVSASGSATASVTVVLSAWLDDEQLGSGLVLGGLFVLAGVYLGALRTRGVHLPLRRGTGPSGQHK
jgi:drug/metabolite transporter (DMT)-like permease